MKFKLNYKQYSDFINLTNNVFFPLKNFVNQDEFNSILINQKYKKDFFSFPIFFGLNKKKFNQIKNKKYLIFTYKSKNIALVKNLKFFSINKNLFGKKIFGKNFKKHPYFKIFQFENHKFLNFKINKKFKNNNLLKDFVKPSVFKKKTKLLKYLPSFHTRNVPHSAHQWIHKLLFKRYNSLLIHPLIGQYKKGEYNDKYILKTNQKASEMLNSKNVFCLPFYSYPRYGGPLEASLHALVRRNYGCTHFWVGRDHAGYKDFFSKYQSQFFCKKNQNKLNIKIISKKEPFYCKLHKKITNSCKNKKCRFNKVLVSGSKIRQILLKKKRIPEYLMSKEISKIISFNALIK